MAFDTTKITDHLARLLADWLSYYLAPPSGASAPIATAVTTNTGNRAQGTEDLAYAVYEGFLLDTAIGAQLDVLGRIVGEQRAGRGDSIFRAAIRTRLAINLGSGTTDHVINTVSALIDRVVYFLPQYPAACVLQFTNAVALTSEEVATLLFTLPEIIPAGVGYHVVEGNLNAFQCDTAGRGCDDGELGVALV